MTLTDHINSAVARYREGIALENMMKIDIRKFYPKEYQAVSYTHLDVYKRQALQSVISISVDMLPLPGGMGISEGLFLNIFKKIFVGGLLYPAMLLSRGISYYALVLISAVTVSYTHLEVKFLS